MCDGSSLRSISVQGQNVHWYSDAALTKELAQSNEIQIPASAATYYATQTVGGCTSDALATKVELMEIDSRLYYSAGAIRTRATEADYFYWYRNGVYYRYTTVPYIIYDGKPATYVVDVVKGQCQEYSEAFESQEENITAVEEVLESIFEVFPNPASSHIVLKSKHTNMSIGIFDAMGKIVYTASMDDSNELILDVSKWSKGVYLIVGNDGKNVYKKRLVLY
jgi:hypothetical protein